MPADAGAAPCVTVLTPFYNTGPIFHETARSVLRQSLQQWEWLIVDDGSTDPEALEILDHYAHKDPRIRVVRHPENKGLSAALNTGFRESRTPYTALLDSDDLLEPTALEKWLWFLGTHPEYAFVQGYSVAFGAIELIWQKGFVSGEDNLETNRIAGRCLVRNSVHEEVGGFNESNRTGLQDWEFWIHCAHAGYWGYTIPEFCDWYRRRAHHADRWEGFDDKKLAEIRAGLRKKYASLWMGSFPRIEAKQSETYELGPDALPFENLLQKSKRRLLMLLPRMTRGGGGMFYLDPLDRLIAAGWEVTIATTLPGTENWMPSFARRTPDVFVLSNFLRSLDYPRFLRYLIRSRRIETVLISNSLFGYQILPFLRSEFPHVTFVDCCHVEKENGRNGGYRNHAVEHQPLLDLNIVSSQRMKQWMVDRGADPNRVCVCTDDEAADDSRPMNAEGRLDELLDRAAEFHRTQPRPEVSRLLSRLSASYTVQYERLNRRRERFEAFTDDRDKLDKKNKELTDERDKWYRRVLARGDELQALRSNILVRLCSKLGLVSASKASGHRGEKP